ncbi:hypothetical protein BS17DRAFT_772373 [Gyrodon lividus]|nr:hypothetical protein BS17DRAFT_772373 [Gyrodon lividus]
MCVNGYKDISLVKQVAGNEAKVLSGRIIRLTFTGRCRSRPAVRVIGRRPKARTSVWMSPRSFERPKSPEL